ncbi:MAG: hypothetical protein ABEI80_05175 [Haloplanus sp.]
MIRTKLVAVAVAALLVTVGTVAAAPGAAPVTVGADDQYDDNAAQAEGAQADGADGAARDGGSANDTDDAGGPPANVPANGDDASAAERGPPADLPAQVPDHVAAIHDLIGSFLRGDLSGSLGDAVSGVTPGGDAGDQGERNADTVSA